MHLKGSIKDYLLAETGGKSFPKGNIPDMKTYAQEVLGTAGIKLWPMQKLILKVINNSLGYLPPMPLTPWEERRLAELVANGKSPIGDGKYAQCVINKNAKSRTPTVVLLVCGRGSSKSFLSGFLVSYFTRFLLGLKDCHKFFGLAKVKPIMIQCLAGKEAQAVSLFRNVKSHVGRCSALNGTYDELKQSLNFGNIVEARAYTSNSHTVRGEDTFCYYHEETAFCNEETPDNEKSFTQCYHALHPAVKNRFGSYGVELFATSAGLKIGQTYELYKKIKDGTIQNAVLFQLAIWEINPNFTKADFQQEYEEDSVTADAEHGSQFVDAKNTFLTPAEVYSTIKADRQIRLQGEPGIDYWMRIDPSRKHDRYALAIGHKEKRKGANGREEIVAVVDHVHYWSSFWVDAEGNRVRPRTAAERNAAKFVGVNTQEILDYMHHMVEKFNIVGMTSDQFESQYIVEEMNESYGTEEFPFGAIESITEKSNWLAYRNLKKLIYQRCLEIYPEQAFIEEALVAMRYNKNKPLEQKTVYLDPDEEQNLAQDPNLIYTVQAPRTGSVTTDDVLDAVTYLCWDMMSNMDLAPMDAGAMGPMGGHRDSVKDLKQVEPERTTFTDTIPEEW